MPELQLTFHTRMGTHVGKPLPIPEREEHQETVEILIKKLSKGVQGGNSLIEVQLAEGGWRLVPWRAVEWIDVAFLP